MSIMKVIEVLAKSPKSWEDAAQCAVACAAKSLHGIKSIYVKDFSAEVRDGKIVEYRVDAKITFEVDHPHKACPAS